MGARAPHDSEINEARFHGFCNVLLDAAHINCNAARVRRGRIELTADYQGLDGAAVPLACATRARAPMAHPGRSSYSMAADCFGFLLATGIACPVPYTTHRARLSHGRAFRSISTSLSLLSLITQSYSYDHLLMSDSCNMSPVNSSAWQLSQSFALSLANADGPCR